MSSSTTNVKLGVCSVVYNGVDLGYSKGGVEVEVATETYKSMVDQFGNTPIKEYITARTCVVRCPLAETTLENLNRIMPGSTFTDNGTKQQWTFTEAVPANATIYKITVNGVSYQFLTTTTVEVDLSNGLLAAVNADPARAMDATVVADELVLTARTSGVSYTAIEALDSGGNFDTVVETTAAVSGSKLVDVVTAVSTDLLALAGTLTLHPTSAGASVNEDFTIPLAGVAGGLAFSYKLDEERLFNVEFNAYPDDSAGGLLFRVGDPTA